MSLITLRTQNFGRPNEQLLLNQWRTKEEGWILVAAFSGILNYPPG